jgi:hypothetical protein
MARLPKLGFGDIVSGAIHDYFNKHGAQGTIPKDPAKERSSKRCPSLFPNPAYQATFPRHSLWCCFLPGKSWPEFRRVRRRPRSPDDRFAMWEHHAQKGTVHTIEVHFPQFGCRAFAHFGLRKANWFGNATRYKQEEAKQDSTAVTQNLFPACRFLPGTVRHASRHSRCRAELPA